MLLVNLSLSYLQYLVKELQVLKSERDQLETEVKNVKQIVISLEQEKQVCVQ